MIIARLCSGDSRYVFIVMLGFKETFKNIISRSPIVFVRFSYPGQLLLEFVGDQYIWRYPSDRNKIAGFNIGSIEVLKKRNKANSKCLEDSINFDSLWLISQHWLVGFNFRQFH